MLNVDHGAVDDDDDDKIYFCIWWKYFIYTES